MEAGRKYHAGDLPGRLVREAREMLEAGGLKQLSLRALAARAGITAASLYHHYDSKTALPGPARRRPRRLGFWVAAGQYLTGMHWQVSGGRR